MHVVRRLISVFSIAIAVWVLASVAGAFFDPAHAEFWSASLMWSLLSSLLVAPALVIFFDSSLTLSDQSERTRSHTPSAQTPSESKPEGQKSFIEGESGAYPMDEGDEDEEDAEHLDRPDWVKEQSE